MIQLEIEVGGDKAGELLVVVLLIHMEELVVGGRNNGKTVLCQMLAEQGVELLQLRGIDKVGHVHSKVFWCVEVQFLQFVFTSLQAFHEVQLFLGVFNKPFLLTGAVVVVAP